MPAQITEWSSALMTSLAAAMALFFSAIPKILGFLVIVIAGWFIASLIDRAVAAILRAIRFNELASRAGLTDFVDVLVALVVLVIGGLAARALGNLVRGAAAEGGITNASFLAKIASVLVWAFAIVVAVNRIGIATTLVNTLFMAFVGAIALGAGLAFGLGGRDTAGELVRTWYQRAQRNRGEISRTADAMERRAAENAGSFNDPLQQWRPSPADRRHDVEGGFVEAALFLGGARFVRTRSASLVRVPSVRRQREVRVRGHRATRPASAGTSMACRDPTVRPLVTTIATPKSSSGN